MGIILDFGGYEALRHAGAAMADATLDDFLARYADRETRDRVAITRADIAGHVEAFAAAMVTNAPALWLHHLGWAKSYMVEREWSEADVLRLFELLGNRIAEHTGDPEAIAMFDHGMAALPSLPSRITCEFDPRLPYGDVSRNYLDCMLDFDKPAARQVLLEAGLPLPTLYMHVIGPAMHRVGELWHLGRITTAHEHSCTAMTSDLVIELRNGDAPRRNGRRVMAACVAGERHEIGLRMVADIFEFHGWVSLFLGADVPSDSLVTVAGDFEAELLAVSVSMTANLPEVRRIADGLHEAGLRTKLLVGGVPFQLAPTVHKLLGADATAADPESAVRMVESVMAV